LSTSHISTLSLHDALPISILERLFHTLQNSGRGVKVRIVQPVIEARFRVVKIPICPFCSCVSGLVPIKAIAPDEVGVSDRHSGRDRKSTRLNSSHLGISYA